MERTCLQHLDTVKNWELLRHKRPSEDQVLSWRPVMPIFVINLIQFMLFLSIAFFVIELSSGSKGTEIRQDIGFGFAIVSVLAASLAFYVMYLYRRSWNRRAAWLSADRDE